MNPRVTNKNEALVLFGSPLLNLEANGAGKLATALRRLMPPNTQPPTKLDLTPGCAFGVVVDERLKEMERQLGEVKDRLNGLIYMVIGAVVVDVVLRLIK